jgi:flagellin-like hook-associated protein FlgL
VISINNTISNFIFNRAERNSRVENKALERLSSGLRINRAADDAAGLAISEKMRAQSRGLEQAKQNIQDGVSLLQTADGALDIMQKVVQRMRHLAVQASNDSLTDDDRSKIQSEIVRLKEEIQREIDQTEFNTIKLFKGGKVVLDTSQTSDTVPTTENYKRGVLQTFNEGEVLNFNRGAESDYQRGETFVASPGTTNTFNGVYRNDYNFISQKNYVQILNNGINDTALGWSDNNTVVFSSDRDGGNYSAKADGSSPPTQGAGAYTSNKIELISGDKLFQQGSDLAVMNSDGSNVKTVATNVNLSDASFSPDGTKILYSQKTNNNTNVYTVNYDTSTNTVGGRTLINNSNDLQNVSQTFALNNPELYDLTGTHPSVMVWKRGATGNWHRVSYDNTNGFSVSGGNLTLNGTSQRSASDRILIRYQRADNSTPTDNEKVFTIPTDPELYNVDPSVAGYDASGPKGLRVYNMSRGWEELKYNTSATPTDGYTYDKATRQIHIYGSDRPAANERMRIYYQHDYPNGANQDGVVSVSLGRVPEIYNVDPSLDFNSAIPYDPNGPKSMRVYLYNNNTPIKEIPYDSTNTDGYSYDPTTNQVNVYGSYRPDANQDVKVFFATDSPATTGNRDEENEYVIPGGAGKLQPISNTKTVEILENGSWTPILEDSTGEPGSGGYKDAGVDPNKYFSIDYNSGILKLHKNARLDPSTGANSGTTPQVRITYTNTGDNKYVLLGPIADYSTVTGNSESVEVNGSNITQQQSGPNGYSIGGATNNTITLQGNDRIKLASTVKIEYLVDDPTNPDDGNAFLLPSDFADYGANGSEVVRFTGENLNGSFTNKVLKRGVDYIIDPTNPRRFILQGNSRLSENNGAAMGTHGQSLSIEYLPDDPTNNGDGNEFLVPSGFETGYNSERVYLTGQTIGTGLGSSLNNQLLTRGVDYTISGSTLKLIGNSRLLGDNGGAGHNLKIEHVKSGANDFTLLSAPPQYEPGMDGSEQLFLTGETIGGVVSNKQLVQGTDYTISGNHVSLIGNSRLVGGQNHTLQARFIRPGENHFEFDSPTIDTEDGVKINSERFSNMVIKITDSQGNVKTINATDNDGNQIDPDLKLNFVGNKKSVEFINSNRLVGGPFNIEMSYDYKVVYQKYKTLDLDLKVHEGANEGQTVDLNFAKVSLYRLGIKDMDLSTRDGAEKAITMADNALKYLSDYRIGVGAKQNSLEHALDYVSIESVESQSSESQIRDADMAKEITTFTRSQIMSNAAQAMLAQANSNSKVILQLLK